LNLDERTVERSAGADLIRFAHESERRFAGILDYVGVPWEYEPVEFALQWDGDGQVTRGFRPDFWLPEQRLFVEMTTLHQHLVTKKNGKIRRLAQLYPEVRVKVLYRRDTLALLAKYGWAGGAELGRAALGVIAPVAPATILSA
jgi:hypoxanthine phosphoribosyltransferase